MSTKKNLNISDDIVTLENYHENLILFTKTKEFRKIATNKHLLLINEELLHVMDYITEYFTQSLSKEDWVEKLGPESRSYIYQNELRSGTVNFENVIGNA